MTRKVTPRLCESEFHKELYKTLNFLTKRFYALNVSDVYLLGRQWKAWQKSRLFESITPYIPFVRFVMRVW